MLLTALLVLGSALPLAATTVAVTTGTKYQVIQGFGASSYSESISTAEATSFFTDQSNAALGSQNGNSIGLSILRLSIDEGGNFGTEGNDAKTSVGINPALEVFASSWSPPAADKACNCVNGPGTGQAANTNTNFAPAAGSTNVPSNLPAFATFQANFAKTMKSTYGVNLYAISPQNEPDWNTTYDSCLWTPQQFDTYIPLLSTALNTAGMSSVKIMMPESFADNLAGSATTMADANAAPLVSIVGMHLYGGGPNAIPASYSTVAGHAIQGWVTEISEHSSSGTPFSDTMYYAQQIHKCIVDTGFNAYCYWWLVNLNSDDEGLYTSGAAPTSTYYMMGNWAKFIRPGYMRVSCTEAPATGVQVSAYTGTATEGGATVNRVVIVAINSSGSAVSQAFNFTDQTVTETYPWITSSSVNFTPQAVQAVSGGQFTYSLPANSITTFVSDCGSASTPTVSPTSLRSSTSTPSRTLTPSSTASGTVTPSRSPSDTPMASPSSTVTVTSTRSSTASPTVLVATATASPTATPSRSSTPLPSASSTATQSSTPLPSSTVSPTFTPALGTPTPSSTETVVLPSPSSTASFTAASSPSASASPSTGTTDSATASPTQAPDTATSTATPSATAMLDSPTVTSLPSATGTATATPTASALPSDSATDTPAATLTRSRTASPTVTATPWVPQVTMLSITTSLDTGGPQLVVSGSGFQAGATVSLGGTSLQALAQSGSTSLQGVVPAHADGSVDVVVTNPNGQSVTLMAAFTFVPVKSTSTVTPSDTATAAPAVSAVVTGPLKILKDQVIPNPGAKDVAFLLNGPADSIVVRLWTPSYILVASVTRQGPFDAGWNRVPLPVSGLRPGLYFLTLEARSGAAKSLPVPPLRLVLLQR